MKLEQIYELNIELGIKNDLRGAEAARKQLKREREKYSKLSEDDKKDFDSELLINPYTDSRLAYGDLKTDVKKVLAGIDMEVAEVVIAKQLGDIDLVITHHPVGRSLTELDEQMHLQAEVLAGYGVPINIAEGVVRERIATVMRKIHAGNNEQVVDNARLLNMPLLNAHTTCDNQAANFVKKALDKAKPVYVHEVMDALLEIPEYRIAKSMGIGPIISSGSANNRCGKIAVTEFTGGTDGSQMMYEKMAQAGIGTVLSMHLGEESRKEAEKHHINVVVAGHMSSDSLGMNLFLDELEKKGVKIVPTSGLIRVSRNNKKSRK